MNAKQLIQSASLLHERDKSARDMFREIGREAAKGFDGYLADHILATVREDDDEPVDEAWVLSISPLGRYCVSDPSGFVQVEYSIVSRSVFAEYVRSETDFDTVPTLVKTRGQFRMLCHLLGVPLKEGTDAKP